MKVAPVVETYDRIVREVKSDLVIVGAGEFVGGNKTPVVVKAIWDTGAYGSVISPKVASELGLAARRRSSPRPLPRRLSLNGNGRMPRITRRFVACRRRRVLIISPRSSKALSRALTPRR